MFSERSAGCLLTSSNFVHHYWHGRASQTHLQRAQHASCSSYPGPLVVAREIPGIEHHARPQIHCFAFCALRHDSIITHHPPLPPGELDILSPSSTMGDEPVTMLTSMRL